MLLDENEEGLLRSVALQNARAVLLARERAEKETVEAKQRVTRILESITDGFYALDKEWHFTYLNRKGEEILSPLRRSRDDLMGKSFWEEFPAFLGTDIEKNYRRAFREQATVEFETYFQPLDQWFEFHIYSAPDGLSVYFRDATERRRSLESLRISEGRLRAMFNQAAVGMAIASLDGHLEQLNLRFSQFLGYSSEELLGKSFLEVTHPEDLEKTGEKVRKLISAEIEDYTLEKRYQRKNGEIVWGMTSVTLLKDQQGRPEKFVGIIEDITTRKHAEAAVREGAERLQLALSAGHLGDWSWNAATDLLTLGPEACRAFVLPKSSVVSWSALREQFHPDDRQRDLAAVAEALAKKSDYASEYRIQRDQSVVWIASRGRGVYSADGAIKGMIGVVQNVTGQKEAEKTRSRLASVVESSDDSIISTGLDTVIMTWNKGAERMFGYTAAEVIGKSVAILIPPDSEDEEPKILQRLLNGERIDHYETLRARNDGTLLNVSLTVSPIYDSANNIVGVSKISRDITDRKRAEEALKDERRILELLNDTGKAIASQLDLRNLVQTVTDASTALTGAKFGAFFYNVANEQGESLMLYTLSGASREAFENFGQPRATAIFSPTFKGEAPVRSEDITKDPRYGQTEPHFGMPKGHLPVKSYLAVPVVSRSGAVIGGLFFGHPEPAKFTERAERLIVGVAAQAAIAIDNARLYDGAQREIAERKRVEEALREAQDQLRRHADKLEEQVAERTARLRETIQELEAFSYSVSHDMRSPLRAMQGYSDALLEDYKSKLDEPGQDYLKRIRRAASRMDLLIQDVLAYSRVAKGEIALEKVKIENVIHDVIQNYPALQADQALITVHSPLPPVLGHEAYLTQIVSNFLNNAVKFVSPGTKPRVDVRATIQGDMVRVSFEDNGIGIAPEHQAQIFQIFGRVYSEKQFEGTGIGLAIAKKAAERMGGFVGVVSELGRGSQFFVLLKRAL
ncbi:MAG: hypothetical protein JWM99_3667 [Verrucomicrobiales bacterium]|nr:hypothetical protein [Verrucomicrobiales bacterium]